jgi:hypothetical protein
MRGLSRDQFTGGSRLRCVVPVLGDKGRSGPACEQRAGVGIVGGGVGLGAGAAQSDPAQVADTGRERHAHEVEQGEVDQGGPGRVRGVFGMGKSVWLPRISSST